MLFHNKISLHTSEKVPITPRGCLKITPAEILIFLGLHTSDVI